MFFESFYYNSLPWGFSINSNKKEKSIFCCDSVGRVVSNGVRVMHVVEVLGINCISKFEREMAEYKKLLKKREPSLRQIFFPGMFFLCIFIYVSKSFI